MTTPELQALARAVEAQRPPLPAELLSAQRRRLLSDPRARIRAVRRAAAVIASGALALSLAAAAWVFVLSSAPPTELVAPPARHSAAEPGPSERRLQDGSWIRLDAGALGELAAGEARDVRFELRRGRAEFDVTPDRERTFHVTAGDYEVRVLGTSFSVEYAPEGRLAVAVLRGAVSVLAPGRAPTRLDAGHQLMVSEGRWALEPVPNELPARVEAPTQGSELEAAAAPPDTAEQRVAAPSSHAPPPPDWRRSYRSGDYAGALRLARSAGLERLSSQLDAAALSDLADSARLGGDARAALQLLAALEQRFSGSKDASRATFLSGRLLAREGRHEEAISAFERYLARAPDGDYASETQGRLMQAYAAAGDPRRARAVAETYLARYPEGPYRLLARSLVAGQ